MSFLPFSLPPPPTLPTVCLTFIYPIFIKHNPLSVRIYLGGGTGRPVIKQIGSKVVDIGFFITNGLLGLLPNSCSCLQQPACPHVLLCFSGRNPYECTGPETVWPFGVHIWRQNIKKTDKIQQSDNRRWQYMFWKKQACKSNSRETRYESVSCRMTIFSPMYGCFSEVDFTLILAR